MGRRRLFTRMRHPGDASLLTDSELERITPAEEPVPELPPAQIVAGPPEAQPRSEARRARPPALNLSLVRRERKALLRERERRVRDLGGLLLEMYRRDQFREDLVVEHCAQTMGIENRIHELEAILARRSFRHTPAGPRCSCGAPLLFGARFCASCGRPTDLAASGALCPICGQPVAASASFCPSCGALLEADAETGEHLIPQPEPEPGEHGAQPEGRDR